MLVAFGGENSANGLCNVSCLAFCLLACVTNGVPSRLPVGVNMDGRRSVDILHGVLVSLLLTAIAEGVGLGTFQPLGVIAINL